MIVYEVRSKESGEWYSLQSFDNYNDALEYVKEYKKKHKPEQIQIVKVNYPYS